MKTYQYLTEPVNWQLLYRVLESARKQSSDIVIIPRFLKSEYNGFQIAGLQSGTLTVLSEFGYIYEDTPLWSNPALSYIALYSKDIPPYLKIIKENNIDDLYFNIHGYIVNNTPIYIARTLKSDKQVYVKNPYLPDADPELMSPLLPLLPYQEYLDRIRLMKEKYDTGEVVNRMTINMKDNEEFVEIWAGMTSDGSRIWVPDITKYGDNLKPYILYLAKVMFTFSKSDEVYLEIRDNIQNERDDVFMAQFIVTRHKGKDSSIHRYYISGLKI